MSDSPWSRDEPDSPCRRICLIHPESGLCIGGYRSGRWRRNRHLLEVAAGVDWRAREYGAQLKRCEARFRCRHWYQFFCH